MNIFQEHPAIPFTEQLLTPALLLNFTAMPLSFRHKTVAQTGKALRAVPKRAFYKLGWPRRKLTSHWAVTDAHDHRRTPFRQHNWFNGVRLYTSYGYHLKMYIHYIRTRATVCFMTCDMMISLFLKVNKHVTGKLHKRQKTIQNCWLEQQ